MGNHQKNSGGIMSWYAQTDEAKKHLKECEGCENCIWIEESAHAMQEYGTPVKKYKLDMPTKAEESNNKNKHPLYDLIMEKFCK